MAQMVRAPSALAEVLGSDPSTHIEADTYQVPSFRAPLAHGTQTFTEVHTGKTHICLAFLLKKKSKCRDEFTHSFCPKASVSDRGKDETQVTCKTVPS